MSDGFVLISIKRILTALEDVSKLVVESPVRTGRIVAGNRVEIAIR